MLVISIRTLIEEAMASPGERHLSGNIRDPEALFQRDSMEALEASHAGPLAFLAFDPMADSPIADYLLEGTLPHDSGLNLLVMFITSEAPAATRVSQRMIGGWLDVATAADPPAREVIAHLFESHSVPPLPGIAFFSSLVDEHRALYVGLAGLTDAADMRAHMRTLVAQADQAWAAASGDRQAFLRELGALFLHSGVSFDRTARLSVREWLITAYKFLGRHKADLVGVVSFGGAIAKGIAGG